MGTRSGTIDPTVIPYLMKKKNLTPDQMEKILNAQSGLLGISGVSNDFRTVLAASKEGNERATLAIKMLGNAIKKYIGSYAAEVNGLDALVFTAGMGENQYQIRELACENLEWLGIVLDKDKNEHFERGIPFDITGEGSRVKVLIVPTDEEYMIALDTERMVK